MTSLTDIRQKFLSYYESHGHAIVPSSPLVPRNDPTLMFTNSGMVQFKNVFTGAETRPYSRATTAQKCVRAGGKHNDLENVGYTARHHTFFEMLGNFSFGDYFKEEAIAFAWNLITKEFGLPQNKLLVTVYSEDEQAAELWRKIAGFSDDRIIRIPTSDNFWSMGDTGPCGPCSEIFFDHGDKVPGGPPGSADQDGDRFIEIWNLVFMQYEQVSKDVRHNLPRPSIDTGMGLERVAAVLQGKHDNYDVDLLRAIIEQSAHLSNTSPDGPQSVSHRVIADHLRASAFLIADGVLPSNEGRGYVLRRIMRRAMRHAHQLGCRDPHMHRLVHILVQLMGAAYPELQRAQALIAETLRLEETRFKQTLERGLRLLDDETSKLQPNGTLNGDVAFKLYDTFGFPLDLTRDVLRAQNMRVDEDAFAAAMEQQKADARAAWKGSGDTGTEQLWFELKDQFGSTEFLGYDTDKAEGTILAVIQNGVVVDNASAGDVAILVNQTPFYAESGGQVGDTGAIFNADINITITDTQKKLGGLFVHLGTIQKGTVKKGAMVEMRVNSVRRKSIRANHSATHLLHEALRQQLGTHVAQKGSLVAPDRLRFDITQPVPLTEQDIAVVERAVNERVQANSVVTTRLMTPDEAIKEGAMALFGEKYGDEVRVVSMGGIDAGQTKPYSLELCGGIHVDRTGDIGLVAIVGESAVSAGVRRIEALTQQAAIDYYRSREAILVQSADLLKSSPHDLPARIKTLLDDRRKMERDIQQLRQQLVLGSSQSTGDQQMINGVAFAPQIVHDVPAKDLKSMVDQLKQKMGSGVVAIASVENGKVSLVVGVTPDLVTKISAVELVKLAANTIGGQGGGGRPDLAQAGGSDASQLDQAMKAISHFIENAA